MNLDLTDTIAPRSDQMNADDLMSGPRTFTITEVRKSGSADQPVDIFLAEFPASRPFKPSKSMRRIMVMAWGKDGANYCGKQLTLYRDPSVQFGGQAVGGIRISAMSDLPERLQVALTVTRGRRAPYRVDVIPPDTTTAPVVSANTLNQLAAMFDQKGINGDARLAGVNNVTGGSATSLEVITEDQARRVLQSLKSRPDAPVQTEASELARQQQDAATATWGDDDR